MELAGRCIAGALLLIAAVDPVIPHVYPAFSTGHDTHILKHIINLMFDVCHCCVVLHFSAMALFRTSCQCRGYF